MAPPGPALCVSEPGPVESRCRPTSSCTLNLSFVKQISAPSYADMECSSYMAKAPAKLVEESKQQLAALQAEIAAIKDRLASLG